MAAAQANAISADQLIINLASSGPVYLNVGDYLTLGVWTSTGADYVAGSSGISMERVG
jgi:hypothetical protein